MQSLTSDHRPHSVEDPAAEPLFMSAHPRETSCSQNELWASNGRVRGGASHHCAGGTSSGSGCVLSRRSCGGRADGQQGCPRTCSRRRGSGPGIATVLDRSAFRSWHTPRISHNRDALSTGRSDRHSHRGTSAGHRADAVAATSSIPSAGRGVVSREVGQASIEIVGSIPLLVACGLVALDASGLVRDRIAATEAASRAGLAAAGVTVSAGRCSDGSLPRVVSRRSAAMEGNRNTGAGTDARSGFTARCTFRGAILGRIGTGPVTVSSTAHTEAGA